MKIKHILRVNPKKSLHIRLIGGFIPFCLGICLFFACSATEDQEESPGSKSQLAGRMEMFRILTRDFKKARVVENMMECRSLAKQLLTAVAGLKGQRADPGFVKYAQDLEMGCKRLAETDYSGTIEPVDQRFNQVVSTCISCHNLLREDP